eukprot:CAMPEP_0168320190 /NCGR_PEP_ID=MMETSP0213-20121227/1506_1 /TAXON_ID=151035 /ORGANISM="Euplotes harpa, Strain FSP1.4" /LENGTH=236 /DNA_ID=CAMNT_0008321559 /DNA_START=13 /DNA_END=723 /DNA_ORIENTATION=+
MSYEDCYSDLLAQGESDGEDPVFDLGKGKKNKVAHSFMFQKGEETKLMREINTQSKEASRRRNRKKKHNKIWCTFTGADMIEERKVFSKEHRDGEAGEIRTFTYSSSEEEKAANDFIAKYHEVKVTHDFDNQKVMEDIDNERYYGNTEYKFLLKCPTPERLAKLTTQMKFRMQEGNGEAFYCIGVKDNGEAVGISQELMETSLRTVQQMACNLKIEIKILSVNKGRKGEIVKLMVN